MKKKTNIKNVIRQIVREEVAVAIKEVITELRQPSLSSEPTKKPTKVVKKKSYTNNSVLNDVLNETAQGGEWKTLGGKEFTTERMNELVGGQYGDMMKDTPQQSVSPSDPMAQFVNKDYREVLKKTEEKQKQKHGR
jgi:hypothetical protein